jgi:sulfite dehydrogenase (cytochrome) subunit B
MWNRSWMAITFAAAMLGVSVVAPAAPKTIMLPPDAAQLRPSAMPGYAKAQADCTVCHSAEYMLYQPPNATRAYWEAMAKRMKTVFKAPFSEEDIPAIVDYLNATYGSQQVK